MIALIFLILGTILGARLHDHINPVIDKAWAWVKEKLAKTA